MFRHERPTNVTGQQQPADARAATNNHSEKLTDYFGKRLVGSLRPM